ncbi:unnamed protein product [Symbiodinium natans]|uniref:Uncharacterized protein n=1 Tax=Symbiodinium natans TaxID=878477 RepID=A0A812IQE8_9DINO|nr:unnamed protein product [Symbiodinium natans]
MLWHWPRLLRFCSKAVGLNHALPVHWAARQVDDASQSPEIQGEGLDIKALVASHPFNKGNLRPSPAAARRFRGEPPGQRTLCYAGQMRLIAIPNWQSTTSEPQAMQFPQSFRPEGTLLASAIVKTMAYFHVGPGFLRELVLLQPRTVRE